MSSAEDNAEAEAQDKAGLMWPALLWGQAFMPIAVQVCIKAVTCLVSPLLVDTVDPCIPWESLQDKALAFPQSSQQV